MSSGDQSQDWLWSGAWILAAIMTVDSEDGAELADVVAAADGINHAIVMDSEVEPAVRKYWAQT